MSVHISARTQAMPASAIRKLVPLADAAKAQGVKVYHLNVGAPDIKSPDCAFEAVVSKCKGMHHLSYTNSAGLMELRQGMVEKYYKKIGIDIEVPELLIDVAGSEAFAVAMQVAADPGDEIIVVEPFYTNYQTFAYLNGITLKAVPTDIREGFKVPDIAEFEKLVTPKTRAVLLSNPCNPSGKLFTKDEMLAIGDFCRRHDLFLISDEVYREFCYTDEPHFSAMNIPGCEQNVILADSVSKRYNLCGARIGCIVSHNKDVMAAAMKFAQSRLCPPVLGQYAAIGALDTHERVVDRNVLRLPEGVLALQVAVVDLDIPGMLETVVAEQPEVADLDIAAVHEDIIPFMRLDILDVDPVAGPESLLGVGHHDVAELDVPALAEHLGRFLLTVAEFHPAAVPERRTRTFRETAVRRQEILAAPEYVFAFKLTVMRLDIGPLLDGGFSFVDGDILQVKPMPVVQRPLTSELLIQDLLHNCIVRLRGVRERRTKIGKIIENQLVYKPSRDSRWSRFATPYSTTACTTEECSMYSGMHLS